MELETKKHVSPELPGLTHVLGNTWCMKVSDGVTVPVYFTGPREVVLIDSGYHERSTEALLRGLDRNGLKPSAVLTSHYHPDHVGNHLTLREKYGAEIIMNQKTAAILSDAELVAMTYWQMNPAWTKEHMAFMHVRPDRIFDTDAAEVDAGGAVFRVVPLPGHTLDHTGFITPDGVLYAGDAMMSESMMTHVKLPTSRSWKADRETEERLARGGFPACILAHDGAYTEAEMIRLAERNLADRAARTKAILTIFRSLGGSFTLEEAQETLWDHLQLHTKHYLNIRIFERNVFCMIRYLEDEGLLTEEARNGRIWYQTRSGAGNQPAEPERNDSAS